MDGLNFKEVINAPIVTEGIKEPVTRIANGVVRQLIKVNDIKASSRTYTSGRIVKTKELLDSPTDRVALFANEYIPNHFGSGQFITYYAIVNGERFEIVPVNSNRNGIKIIKQSEFDGGEDHIMYVNETIKTVKIEIHLRTEDSRETPFVSNIKLIQGKGVNE